MKALLIYNETAGHNSGAKYLPKVKSLLDEHKIEYDLLLTQHHGHGVELAETAELDKYDALLAAGGDGTMFEVVNGYFKNNSTSKPPIGVIPVGTGNAFSRDLELESYDIEAAIKIIAGGKTKKTDVGLIKTEGKEYYYVNIVGLGFVTDVTRTAQHLKIFGDLSYKLGVLYHTLFLKSHKLKITLDGKTYERDNVFVEISNTRYTGRDFFMAPDAKIDDGLLDVTLLNKSSRMRLLSCLPKIFTGDHVTMDEVDTFQAAEIKIETDTPQYLSPDGELFGSSPAEIVCLPNAIEVFI